MGKHKKLDFQYFTDCSEFQMPKFLGRKIPISVKKKSQGDVEIDITIELDKKFIQGQQHSLHVNKYEGFKNFFYSFHT